MTNQIRLVSTGVIGALSTGSLYDAMNEIRNIPEASYDAIFITEARLLEYLNKLEAFLGLPLSTTL
jgi:hypothetical protein